VGHEVISAMAAPVLVLAALTLVLGWLGAWFGARLSPGVEEHGALALGAGPLTALSLGAAGIALAWWEYGRRGRRSVASRTSSTSAATRCSRSRAASDSASSRDSISH
jgi:NADH:ubiquinone oxidoreductase subunit 5 (subunit L)/multisubunit Na+/H+ antiporter MnhA subunit